MRMQVMVWGVLVALTVWVPGRAGAQAPSAVVELADLVEQGQWGAAIELGESLTESYGEHADVHLLLGRALTEVRDFQGAHAAYVRALDLAPDSTEVLVELAYAAISLGLREDARRFARKLLPVATKDSAAERAIHHVDLSERILGARPRAPAKGSAEAFVAVVVERALSSQDDTSLAREVAPGLVGEMYAPERSLPGLRRYFDAILKERVLGWEVRPAAPWSDGSVVVGIDCFVRGGRQAHLVAEERELCETGQVGSLTPSARSICEGLEPEARNAYYQRAERDDVFGFLTFFVFVEGSLEQGYRIRDVELDIGALVSTASDWLVNSDEVSAAIRELGALVQRGAISEGLVRADELVRQHPDAADLYLYYGYLLATVLDYKMAERILELGREKAPHSESMLAELGWLYWLTQRRSDALAVANELELAESEDAKALNLIETVQREERVLAGQPLEPERGSAAWPVHEAARELANGTGIRLVLATHAAHLCDQLANCEVVADGLAHYLRVLANGGELGFEVGDPEPDEGSGAYRVPVFVLLRGPENALEVLREENLCASESFHMLATADADLCRGLSERDREAYYRRRRERDAYGWVTFTALVESDFDDQYVIRDVLLPNEQGILESEEWLTNDSVLGAGKPNGGGRLSGLSARSFVVPLGILALLIGVSLAVRARERRSAPATTETLP